MKFSLVIILCLFFYSCTRNDCKIKIGCLLFDRCEVLWGDVFLGEERTERIKMYNPTENKVNIKGIFDYPFFNILSSGHPSGKWYDTGIDIMPNTCDTLVIAFMTNDTVNLGNFLKELRFSIDNQEQYQHLVMDGCVCENFAFMTHEERKDAPVVKVERNEYDFGSMREGDKQKVSFAVRNEGRTPLIIRKIETVCGCTVATLEKRVINPGQSTVLEVSFRAWGKSGKQRKTITMYCNDPLQPVVTFTIQCLIQN